jgi:hypothetical protein
MRAVIYARYSSDQQREASIADQIEVCRRYAERQGWTVVDHYSDAALSGASRHRPAFQKLLREAGQRRFDIVLCEAIDRLGRRLLKKPNRTPVQTAGKERSSSSTGWTRTVSSPSRARCRPVPRVEAAGANRRVPNRMGRRWRWCGS